MIAAAGAASQSHWAGHRWKNWSSPPVDLIMLPLPRNGLAPHATHRVVHQLQRAQLRVLWKRQTKEPPSERELFEAQDNTRRLPSPAASLVPWLLLTLLLTRACGRESTPEGKQ